METPNTVGFAAESWEMTALIATQLPTACPAYIKLWVKSGVSKKNCTSKTASSAKDAHVWMVCFSAIFQDVFNICLVPTHRLVAV